MKCCLWFKNHKIKFKKGKGNRCVRRGKTAMECKDGRKRNGKEAKTEAKQECLSARNLIIECLREYGESDRHSWPHISG